jgi:GT2 family glycosyltransferase
VSGFDERFFLYREEVDLCRRVWSLGLRVCYEPEALAVHRGGASAARSALISVLASSNIRYVQKHHGRIAAFIYRCAFGLHALTHAVLVKGGLRMRAGHVRSLLYIVTGYPATRATK